MFSIFVERKIIDVYTFFLDANFDSHKERAASYATKSTANKLRIINRAHQKNQTDARRRHYYAIKYFCFLIMELDITIG